MIEFDEVEIDVADDGTYISIKIAGTQFDFGFTAADLLSRYLIPACSEARLRQTVAGLAPTIAPLSEAPKVTSYRTSSSPNEVILELIGQQTNHQPEIAEFALEPDVAARLGSALFRSADAARQRRSPS